MKIIEIANGRSDARPTDPKSVLEQRLADLETTVRRRQKDWLAARAAAAAEPQDNLAEIITRERAARLVLEEELVARRAQYERDIARATAVRAMVDEQLREAALEVERARHAEATAAAAVERLARAEADAVARLAEREADFATELSAVTETRDGLEQQLSYVESALSSARQRHELAAKEVEQLTQREAELSAQHADEAATRASLERRIAEVEAALAEVSEQVARDRTVAAEREAAYQACIEQEITKRRRVEDTLASARTSHANAEEQHKSVMTAAAAVLAERETELASLRAEAAAIRHALEQRIADARTAQRDAETHHRSAMATAATRLAEREAQFETELASITGTRDSLERQLRGVENRLTQETGARKALEQAITELRSAAAAAERRFREETATLAETAQAERARLEDQLSREREDHQAKLADEQRQHRSAMAMAATRLAEREAQLQVELASITATRDSLEQQLRDVDAALAHETESRIGLLRAIDEQRSAAADAEQRFRDEIAAITENARADRANWEDQLSRERQQHRWAMAVAATRLAEHESQFQTNLALITATRDSLEHQLRGVENRLTQETGTREALEQAITELRSAAAAAEQRFREETATLAETAQAERVRLEDQLSRERQDHQTALADEQQQHRSAMATAATRLAEREAQLQVELASIIATRDSLEQQLRDVDAALAHETESRIALERAIDEQRSAAADAEQRFRDEIAAITENARADRADWEDQLSRERQDHQTELADERQQHRSAMAVAAARLGERESQFKANLASITATRDSFERQLRGVENRLTQETGTREALEQSITELRSAAAAAEQRFREETATLAETAQAERVRLEDELSRERQDHQTELADEQRQHRAAMATAATRLAEREAQLQAELASIATARASLEQQLRDVEATLAHETEARTTLERLITEARRAAAEAERQYRDEIAAITTHASAERARLEDQIARERALAADRLTARGAEFEAELHRLSAIHASALARFQTSIAEQDSRIEEQGRASAALQTRLDASEAENRRQFEQTPVPLVRCARDGALAGANFAFAALVGCRTPGELRDRFAATLFESPNDLVWLIERSVNSTKTESVETTCIRKDGARVAVRLSARPSMSGVVEIAAEDLTGIRVLEDRLREAHRMEAVGRVASEIAMTCEKLLRGVYREAQRLLDAMTGGNGPRDRAETLLDDVTLAGSILHQLVAYGDEQAASLAPVDVNRILHDLQPVLKQVAGDAITLELRKTSSPVNVDVKAERVERLLVNVASYGRQRMPHGGRLRIELSTVVVDGKFISQHPNVRQGPHALITVTEVARHAADSQASNHASETESRIASARPGVDLGALQELISECGGHLWITAEPGGSMVVKMRLPLRAAWQHQADTNSRHGLHRMAARLLGR